MVAAIIQARMGSTRLPGKVMKQVEGVPLLKYQVDRIKMSDRLDKLIVATSISNKDNIIAEFCKANNIECFRGSENDVLERYYECAKKYNADTIVRLTADCPLSDPDIIDGVIGLFINENADYAANTVPPESSKYPDGTDVEVFSMKALKKAQSECKDPHDREHVTFYFWRYSNGFKTAQIGYDKDLSKYRFTIDYSEDLEVVSFIIGELKKRGNFGHMDEIVSILDSNPCIKEKNSRYHFGIGWKK